MGKSSLGHCFNERHTTTSLVVCAVCVCVKYCRAAGPTIPKIEYIFCISPFECVVCCVLQKLPAPMCAAFNEKSFLTYTMPIFHVYRTFWYVPRNYHFSMIDPLPAGGDHNVVVVDVVHVLPCESALRINITMALNKYTIYCMVYTVDIPYTLHISYLLLHFWIIFVFNFWQKSYSRPALPLQSIWRIVSFRLKCIL